MLFLLLTGPHRTSSLLQMSQSQPPTPPPAASLGVMISRDYVPSPLTIPASWFSQTRQGQLFSQSPHRAFQTAQMHKGKVDIGVSLAFTLPGGKAQEDLAGSLPQSPRGTRTQGVGWVLGSCAIWPRPHWTLPDHTGKDISGTLAETMVSQE